MEEMKGVEEAKKIEKGEERMNAAQRAKRNGASHRTETDQTGRSPPITHDHSIAHRAQLLSGSA
ncbi:hypothetical protein [Streptomyces sp. NPDC057545]|uniref:hypothetical protein n=1 Tax=Streptomyces sp. NPDC057545 TaxID=3346164 RepID=UPI00368CC275